MGSDPSKRSQCDKILVYLIHGHALTPLDARRLFGCDRLAARIYDLERRGWEFTKCFVRLRNGKRVMRYSYPRWEL